MPDVVHGSDVVLSMYIDSIAYPILCATDCTYSRITEKIEKTGPASGGVRQRVIRIEEFVSTVSGLTRIDNDASLTFFYILQEGVRRQEHDFLMSFSDPDGNERQITGPGIIGDMDINGPAGDFSNCNIEILWNDIPEMAIIENPSPSVVQSPLYLPFDEGETFVNHPLLEQSGVEILEVQRMGLGHDEVTGTPGNREFKFTGGAGNGTISFDPTNPSNGDETVYVLYQL